MLGLSGKVLHYESLQITVVSSDSVVRNHMEVDSAGDFAHDRVLGRFRPAPDLYWNCVQVMKD